MIAYPSILNSDWMPYMYVLAYMVFIIAAGSVVAGRPQDGWIFALTGWFLIHGHACFCCWCQPSPPWCWPACSGREGTRSGVGSGFLPRAAPELDPGRGISALFALPIVVNLVLHWPGDFGKYISYGGSGGAGGHGPGQVIEYALWFWWPHHHAGSAPLLGYPAALAAVALAQPGAAARVPAALLAVNVVSSLAFLLYAAVGIDDLTEYYIGYFYWSAPLITLLVIVLAAFEAVPRRSTGRPAEHRRRVGAAVAGVAVLAVTRAPAGSTNDIDPALPGWCPPWPRGRRARRSCCTSTTRPGSRRPGSWSRRNGPGSGPAWTTRVHVPDDQAVHLHPGPGRERPPFWFYTPAGLRGTRGPRCASRLAVVRPKP